MNPFIPDNTIMTGYSGGMALYVANWQSVLYIFELIEVPELLPELNYNNYLN